VLATAFLYLSYKTIPRLIFTFALSLMNWFTEINDDDDDDDSDDEQW